MFNQPVVTYLRFLTGTVPFREAEERLGRELKASLTAQRQQWEEVVTSTREEAEQARQQLEQHWEQQLALVEQRLKQAEEDKVELTRRERIDSGQRAGQSGKQAELELELQRGKAELQRYRDQALHSSQELERQKGEVGVMMGRWRQEMETIQASHGQVLGSNHLVIFSILFLLAAPLKL